MPTLTNITRRLRLVLLLSLLSTIQKVRQLVYSQPDFEKRLNYSYSYYNQSKLPKFIDSHLFAGLCTAVLLFSLVVTSVQAKTDKPFLTPLILENTPVASAEDKVSDPNETLSETKKAMLPETAIPGCALSQTFTPEVLRWEKQICSWSKIHNLDPNLIATIMQIESCGNNYAVSATGVRGLFQVTGANLDGENPFDPNVSMAKGPGKVLKANLADAGGNIKAAMAGYNGGGKALDYIAGNITRNQFYWFLRNHSSGLWWSSAKALAKINEVERYAQWGNIYFEAKEGRRDTLQIWLDLGGSRMCTAASKTSIL